MQTETIDRLFLELSQVTQATTAKEEDLAMLVRRLINRVWKYDPKDEVATKAFDYLQRKGLAGSPLREVDGL